MSAELAAWIPAPIMAAMLLAVCVWFVKSIGRRLDVIEETLQLLKTQGAEHVTKAQLGSMGDRFDQRFATMREDVGAMRERLVRLEERMVHRSRK